jgi:hypothetical protein
LGGIVAECLGIGYEVLVLVVALDADAKHVVDGLANAVEGGAGEGTAFIQVVGEPKFIDVIITDPPCPPNGVNEPNVLSKDVRNSHLFLFFSKNTK